MIGVPGADPTVLAWLLDLCAPVARRFEAAGFQILLVGGMVRDLAAGRDVTHQDLDLTTDARPPDTIAILDGWADAVWRQGERFGTIGARRGPHELEITTFRAEAYDPGSRKPTVTFGDRVDDDLARRDFTVNAMALRLPSGALVDPHHGLDDLAARRLRTPLGPEVSFSEDPLRMLRAARFSAGYGLTPDPALADAARQLAGRMAIVSVERIHDELAKLLRLPDPTGGLRFLRDCGLAPHCVPELATASADRIRPALAAVAATPPDPLLRLVVLLLALDPDRLGAATGTAVRDRLSWLRHSASDIARGQRAAELAATVQRGPRDDAEVRQLLAGAGHDAEAGLEVLEGLEPAAPGAAAAARRVRERLLAEPDLVELGPLLRGDEVMARYGLEPGPEVGRVLAAVRAARLAEGPLTAARAWAVVDEVLGRSG